MDEKKETKKTGTRRDKNKKMLAAWVDKEIYEAVKLRSEQAWNKGMTDIIVEALVSYLDLKKNPERKKETRKKNS
jgi:hypothetical protein